VTKRSTVRENPFLKWPTRERETSLLLRLRLVRASQVLSCRSQFPTELNLFRTSTSSRTVVANENHFRFM
jgi:hypothetical protein